MTDYVEDFEALTGQKREKFTPETKVIKAPEVAQPVAAEAEVK